MSIPTTKALPVRTVTSQVLMAFSIPSLRNDSGVKSNGLLTKAGALNCDVAEYSSSAYRYRYPKQMKRSSM